MATTVTRSASGELGSIDNSTRTQFVIASNFPTHSNPYIALFYGALKQRHITLNSNPIKFSDAWLNVNSAHVQALHFHWPELFWRRHSSWVKWIGTRRGLWRLKDLDSLVTPTLRVRNFGSFLARAKSRGMRIVWTLHNLAPHEGTTYADLRGYKDLARHADLVICHSESARTTFLNEYSTDAQVVVMHIGNYDLTYPKPRSRSDVVRDIGLREDLPLVGCLGLLREYKGLDTACAAIEQLGGSVQLVIAGKAHESVYDVDPLRAQIQRLPQARLIARELTDQEFSDLCSAADLHLLPYRRITGSAALLSALTFSRPVVTSALDFFEEMLRESPDAGKLCPVDNPAAFAMAIKEVLSQDSDLRNRAARRLADRFSWDRVIEPVCRTIDQWRS